MENTVTVLLTPEELGEHLKMTKTQVQYWTKRGVIKGIRITKRTVRYEPSEVERLIKEWGAKQVVVSKGGK